MSSENVTMGTSGETESHNVRIEQMEEGRKI